MKKLLFVALLATAFVGCDDIATEESASFSEGRYEEGTWRYKKLMEDGHQYRNYGGKRIHDPDFCGKCALARLQKRNSR